MYDYLKERGLTWLGRVRFRVAVIVIGVPLALFGALSLAPVWLAVSVVGVAAAVTMTWNRVTSRLGDHVCWTCGHDLKDEPQGVHGVACPQCGALNQHNPVWRNDLLAGHSNGPSEPQQRDA